MGTSDIKMKGVKKRTPKQTKVLMELANNECEDCGSKDNLEIHRITPGYKGGTYLPRNCKILCKECHKLYDEGW